MKHLYTFICLALALGLALPVAGQSQRPLDDRDMFVRYEAADQVMPNVMVLADRSGSMNTAIYHPAYINTVDYSAGGYVLNGILTIFSDMGSSLYVGLSNTTTFKICRGGATQTVNRQASGTFLARDPGNGRRWQVQWNTTSDPFLPGKPIRFYYTNQYVTHNIVAVECNGADCWITVDTDRYPNRSNRRTVTSSYTETVPGDKTAKFILNTQTCDAGSEQHQITLFGITESGNVTRYDNNYLFWLAFFATDQQLIEVKNWATVGHVNYGKFPDPATGAMVSAGLYRIDVLRNVLKDVVNDTYKIVNYGLMTFDADSAGGQLLEVMANQNTGGTLNAFLGTIDKMRGDTWTPLAETLADIWVYFKDGGGVNSQSVDYRPLSDTATNGQCGNRVADHFPSTCPIQYYCQRNYVIVMTDGQSTKDQFTDSKFTSQPDNLFLKPVRLDPDIPGSGWGDGDENDPNPNPWSTQPSPAGYCEQSTCWTTDGGTDFLDDVAFYIRTNDIFPDSRFPDMPGMQNIVTYAIGFTVHNQMLAETAKNGDGKYYISNSYDSLKEALKNAIYDILIREYAFASFTAPKKVTSTIGEGYSYVGFFKPSAADSIWAGFLNAFVITLRWCPDLNGNYQIDAGECAVAYAAEADCEQSNSGTNCLPTVDFAKDPVWRAEEIIKTSGSRNIYTSLGSDVTTEFLLNDPAQLPTLKTIWGLDPADDLNANLIINTIRENRLADIFHGDISFVGAPPLGKTFLINLNPPECDFSNPAADTDCFQYFYEANKNRLKVVYVGTNDGILHQINGATGAERWGFIPDELLPSLRTKVIDKKYYFGVDGRATIDDIYFRSGNVGQGWKTIIVQGLKDGGRSFYALDVTEVGSQPQVLWKFKNDTWSGRSWSKPILGKIRHQISSTETIDRFVAVLGGGMAFNNESNSDMEGKAVFVVDASSGELLWLIGYDPADGADDASSPEVDVYAQLPSAGDPGIKHLTKAAHFNYPIPSAITAIDKDNNGYLDAIYFGNNAGHLYKTDISKPNPINWKTYMLFRKKAAASSFTSTVQAVDTTANTITMSNVATGLVHSVLFGKTSKTMAVVDAVDSSNKKKVTLTIMTPGGVFQVGETIEIPTIDPIFQAPAIAYDTCYNLWVCWGTGDRIRSRTNPTSGNFYALKDGTVLQTSGGYIQKTGTTVDEMVDLSGSWTMTPDGGTMAQTPVDLKTYWGWYFVLPDAAHFEKLFDPEPFVLPSPSGVPHIYFNTYTPVTQTSVDPCKVELGKMLLYDIILSICGNGKVSGTAEVGRIAGGGIFGEPMVYVMYEGSGTPGSIPPPPAIKSNPFDKYRGSLLFWKDKQK